MAALEALSDPVDFAAWVATVRPQLQPPVGNKLLYGAGQQKVMVVGGPNTRRDYHIEPGEEIFFQVEGDMCVETIERGTLKPVPIKQGEIFILPGRVPHSPQRLAGTVGLVWERERLPGEVDGLRWYTRDGSGRVLYEETFHCTDLGTQLKPVIERFFASDAAASDFPARDFAADTPLCIDSEVRLPSPINLRAWAAEHAAGRNAVLFGEGAVDPSLAHFEYRVQVMTCDDAAWAPGGEGWRPPPGGETFLYQLDGECRLTVQAAGAADGASASREFVLGPQHVLLVPADDSFRFQARWAPGSLCLVVTNRVSKRAPAAAAAGGAGTS